MQSITHKISILEGMSLKRVLWHVNRKKKVKAI